MPESAMQPLVPDGTHGSRPLATGVDALAGPYDQSRAFAEITRLGVVNKRLLAMLECERQQLARALHNDAGQVMTAIRFCAQALHHEIDADGRQAGLDEIAQLAEHSVSLLRSLSAGLWPPPLDTLGLAAALRWQATEMFLKRDEVLVLKLDALRQRLPPEVELALFRIAQESLANVLRHARAGRVEVCLQLADGCLELAIDDDGCGISSVETADGGIAIMRLRAQLAGAELQIEPGTNSGTRVLVRIVVSGWQGVEKHPASPGHGGPDRE